MKRALASIQTRGPRSVAPAVDAVTLLAAAALSVLTAGNGRVSAGNALLAGVYVAFVVVLSSTRLRHVARLHASAVDSCVSVLRACSLAALLAIATDAILGADQAAPVALRLWLLTVVSLCAARLALELAGRGARRSGALMTPTLVVGAGVVGELVARRLSERAEFGLRPIGFLDADPMPGAVTAAGDIPVLGGPDDLEDVCSQTGARRVILAFASEPDERLVGLVSRCRALGVDVSVVPRLYESVNERAKLEHIGGLPLLSLGAIDPSGWQFTIKYALDRMAAVVAIALLAPVLLSLALAVRLDSPGPVIFRQRRIGRDGRVFDLLKFRTMTQAAGVGLFTLQDGSAPGGVEGADRRTRIGRWLRASSLDELPQLLNVLRGEMSLVGPRPERPEFVAQFTDEVHRYEDRHRVKSGITGWAQVNGLRGQTSIADRIEWDNYYIENWSFGLELRTLALTFYSVVRFREGEPLVADADVAAPIDQPVVPSRGPASTQPPSASRRGQAPATQRPGRAGQGAAATNQPAASPQLRLVQAPVESSLESVWFCGYCANAPAGGTSPAPLARVCGACGEGLMLEARADGAPHVDEPFLVVDSRLTVQAVSKHAETVLGVREQDATDHPVAELLVGADAETGTEQSLATMLAGAASDGEDSQTAFVRPRDTFGVRLRARIVPCGPPRAALIVFESGPVAPPRLRLAPSVLAAAESG